MKIAYLYLVVGIHGHYLERYQKNIIRDTLLYFPREPRAVFEPTTIWTRGNDDNH